MRQFAVQCRCRWKRAIFRVSFNLWAPHRRKKKYCCKTSCRHLFIPIIFNKRWTRRIKGLFCSIFVVNKSNELGTFNGASAKTLDIFDVVLMKGFRMFSVVVAIRLYRYILIVHRINSVFYCFASYTNVTGANGDG